MKRYTETLARCLLERKHAHRGYEECE
jgi:hypothetical protein